MARITRNVSALVLLLVVYFAASSRVSALACNTQTTQCGGNSFFFSNCNDSCEEIREFYTTLCGKEPNYFNCGSGAPHSGAGTCESRACMD